MRLFLLCIFSLLLLAATAAEKVKNEGDKKPTELSIASGVLVSGSGAPIQVRSLKASIQDGVTSKSGNGSAAPEWS